MSNRRLAAEDEARVRFRAWVEAVEDDAGDAAVRRVMGRRSTGMEIRPPCPVVLAIPHGERQVVHPEAPVGDTVAIVIDDHAIRDPPLGGVDGRRRVRDEREAHVAGRELDLPDIDPGVDIGSAVARRSVYRPVVDGGTITLPAGSVRTGAGQSSPRLASVHRIGGGVAVGAVIPGVGLGATTPGRLGLGNRRRRRARMADHRRLAALDQEQSSEHEHADDGRRRER